MRWQTVSRILPAKLGRVLEIGCGKGAFAARLARRSQDYVALEPDPTSYTIALGTAGDVADVRQSRVEDLPQSEQFDLVCAFEVLEHLANDRAALARWVERLRPGGTLLISTPAHSERLGAWDRMVGHYRRYDICQMHEMLQTAGLESTAVELYGFPAGPLLETARNFIANRRMKRQEGDLGDYDHRTSSSGRLLQPGGAFSSAMMTAAGLPLAYLQRAFPDKGIALVALGKAPQ